MSAVPNIKQAGRSFERLWAPRAASYEMAYHYDAGFDAGEFSGPAFFLFVVCVFLVMVERVAARYGLLAAQLEAHVSDKPNKEFDRWFDAHHQRSAK